MRNKTFPPIENRRKTKGCRPLKRGAERVITEEILKGVAVIYFILPPPLNRGAEGVVTDERLKGVAFV